MGVPRDGEATRAGRIPRRIRGWGQVRACPKVETTRATTLRPGSRIMDFASLAARSNQPGELGPARAGHTCRGVNARRRADVKAAANGQSGSVMRRKAGEISGVCPGIPGLLCIMCCCG